MSEILNRLADGEQITEWIDPWDQRLITATGQKAPNKGGSLRENWRLPRNTGDIAALLVKRCLVSEPCVGDVEASFDRNEVTYVPQDRGTIVLSFSDRRDWSSWFPASPKTEIFKDEDGQQSWAAIGIFAKSFGVAVFSCERSGVGVESRIQPVPQAMFQKILTAE